jgi:predicted DNA-binding ribbon-helix-helix protein
MRLEPELWDALDEICKRENSTLAATVDQIEKRAVHLGRHAGRTSAVRVYIVRYFRAAAGEAGHDAAGHGSLK